MFPRAFLYRLHRVIGLSPKKISECHKDMFGFTILPHGVRTYLKAYGLFEPRTRGKSSKNQTTENKELTSLLEKCMSFQKNSLDKQNLLNSKGLAG